MWTCPEEDSKNYITFVEKCLSDNTLLKDFKSNPAYCNIVGMSTDWQGPHFLRRIMKFPDIFARIKELAENDKYGTPYLMQVMVH